MSRIIFILDKVFKSMVEKYTMNLREYFDWKSIKEVEFAKKLGIDPSYLRRLKHGKHNWTPRMAERVEALTGGHVRKEELVWPER